MKLQARVSDNPGNIGNGCWSVGLVLDIVRETTCHYILSSESRVNKKGLFIVGTSCFSHPVRVEIIKLALSRPLTAALPHILE